MGGVGGGRWCGPPGRKRWGGWRPKGCRPHPAPLCVRREQQWRGHCAPAGWLALPGGSRPGRQAGRPARGVRWCQQAAGVPAAMKAADCSLRHSTSSISSVVRSTSSTLSILAPGSMNTRRTPCPQQRGAGNSI